MRLDETKASALAEAFGLGSAHLLGCGFGFAGVRLGEFTPEAFDAACGVDELLLAGEEGVAGSADFKDDVAFVRGAGLEEVAAGALDVNVVILRVNPLLWHDAGPFDSSADLLNGSRIACNGSSHHIEGPVAPPSVLRFAKHSDSWFSLYVIRTGGNRIHVGGGTAILEALWLRCVLFAAASA